LTAGKVAEEKNKKLGSDRGLVNQPTVNSAGSIIGLIFISRKPRRRRIASIAPQKIRCARGNAARPIDYQRSRTQLQRWQQVAAITARIGVLPIGRSSPFRLSGEPAAPRRATSVSDNPVQVSPYAIERLGHHPGVAQCFRQQVRPLFENNLGDRERLIRVPLFYPLRETFLGLVGELWEMH
jgi:hypothetical protein